MYEQTHRHIVLPSFRDAFSSAIYNHHDLNMDIPIQVPPQEQKFLQLELEPTMDTRTTYFGVSSERGLWETDPTAFQLRKAQITSISILRDREARAARKRKRLARAERQPPRLSAHTTVEPHSSPLLRDQSIPITHEEDLLHASSSPFIPATSLPPSSPPSSPLSMIFSEVPDGRRSSSPFSEGMDLDLDLDYFPEQSNVHHMKRFDPSPEQPLADEMDDGGIKSHDPEPPILPSSPPIQSPPLSALDTFSDDLIITPPTPMSPVSTNDVTVSDVGSDAVTVPTVSEDEARQKRKAAELLDSQVQRKKVKLDSDPGSKASTEKISPLAASSDTRRRVTGVQVLVRKVSADKPSGSGRKTGVQVVTTTRLKPLSKSSDDRRNPSSSRPSPSASCSRPPPRPSSPTQSRSSGSKDNTSVCNRRLPTPPKPAPAPKRPSSPALASITPESSPTTDSPAASSSRSTLDVSTVPEEDEQPTPPSKPATKAKRAPPKRRSKTPLTDSSDDESDSEIPAPPPPPPLPTNVDPELVGMLIETFATSRASSLPLSTAYKSLMSTRPGIKQRHSEQEWMGILSDVLEAGNGGVFGKVESSGKDASERTLEARWFYNPEADADQERASLLRTMMPRPGKRAVTKRYKQYYYQPVDKLRRWPGEEEAW